MVSSKFESLSVRPPTPPKDQEDAAADETVQFLQDPFGEKPIPPRLKAAKRPPNTPEQSPSSDIDIPSSAASARKRVNFELQLCDIASQKAVAQSWTPTGSSPLKPLPQTRLTKPLKSILKPSDGTCTPPADDAANPYKYKSFAEMLDAMVMLLASPERGTRLDAYTSLHRTMQAYDKIPDDQSLRQKMSLLTQFIRRDIQAPSLSGTGLDSQLIGQAMKLLMALFRITDLISAMDDDFCSFIIDRIIRVATDSSMPKTTVNTHLAVLMQQSFRPRTMTATRVEKVLDALDTIHERTSGHAVQAYRVRIYRKLLQQRPDVMIRHTERWFTHTLKALVSVQKDICQSALDTAVTAAKHIGHDQHVAKSVLSVLNRTKSDGATIASVFTGELDRMSDGDYAVLVPQIWAAVTGLLKDSLDAFTGLKDWLTLLQKCISSDKDQVRLYSNIAVSFLTYSVNLVNLDLDHREAWSGMLVKISVHALQRRIPVKKAERDAVSSAYFTLLYYAFRPTASFEKLDRYWTDFIAGLWSPIIARSSPQHAIPCRIVSALLDGSRKPWNEHRALDLRPNAMIQRGELPLVDPKWVRKSIALVLEFVEAILEAALKTESKEQEDEPFQTMWIAVIDSLVEASSKEIMASTETKDAMAHIINLLRRIWDSHTDSMAVAQKKEDSWANKFCFLIETVVQKLGAFQFADKCLTRNDNNEIEVASTPSHRSRHQGTRSSPLLYLVDLLVTQSEGKLADPVRLRAMEIIIEPCFAAQNTRLSKLELLRDCAATVDGSLKGAVASEFWTRIVVLLNTMLQDRTAPSDERGARSFGKEYEIVVEILSLGSAYLLGKPVGHEILSTFVGTVRHEAGDGALALAVIEKVSEQVLKRTPDEDKASCLAYASILLRSLPRQMSRKVLDQGRQNLWPSHTTTARSHDIDPYVHLYGAITSVGSAAYRDLDRDNAEPTKGFLSALSTSVQHCSTSHLAGYLRKIQDAIQVWVEDPEKKMQSKEEPLKSLHREVINMWQEVNKAIERLPRKDSQMLLHLQALVTAGFLSRRRGIVNISIATWNETFGKEDSLRYPARLEQALRRLQNSVELSLPSLEVQEEDAENKLSFYDSDTSADDVKRAFKSPRVKDSPFKISKAARRSKSRSPAVPSSATRRVPSRQTPKIRLRHDNSQIKFEPIASSPSNPFNQESQVLTDRQKEMIHRQRLSSGLFAKMGALSPQPEDAPSPMEIHSDALTADDLPDHTSRTTPLKALAAMGPMDAYLGSSPTPHARKSIRNVVSDDTDIATPTAVRNIQFAADDDVNSSPPRFEQDQSTNKATEPDVLVGSSFEYRQPESSLSVSFDEGTTIDEEARLDAVALHENTQMNTEFPSDTIMSELPSSTIDLQLIAQIDADMQGHDAPADGMGEAQSESNAEYVDAASHPQSSMLNGSQAGSDTEVDESQTPTRRPARRSPRKSSQANTSSTSRVGDSFDKSSAKGTPNSLRRSSRHSMGSPSRPPSGKKARRTPAKKKNKKQTQESPAPAPVSEAEPEPEPEPTILDNIIVASPLPPSPSTSTSTSTSTSNPRGRKRKSTHPSPSTTEVPNTNRKQNLRRSQSLLSQVENSQDLVIVDETPAPKRAKQSADQDVSEARKTTPGSAGSKRLSHVQVSTRPKSSGKTSPASKESDMGAQGDDGVAHDQGEPTTTTQQTQSESLPLLDQSNTNPETNTPSRSFAKRVILTPRSIINQLKSLKDYLFSSPSLVLGRDEEREIDDALFDIRRQVHAAGLRGEGKGGE